MEKKKTTFVWILLVLLVIWLIFTTINIINSLVNIKTLLTPAPLSSPMINVINLVLSIIGLVIATIFFIKLYNVSSDIFKWVNIAFGFVIFSIILGFILTMFVGGILTLILTLIASPMFII